MTKATGKKSKTQDHLDLEDILAALSKHQQAMKARQITNTKPLSFAGTNQHKNSWWIKINTKIKLILSTVGTITPYHSMGLSSGLSMLKTQPNSTPYNPLDSTAPRVKRGKEKEIPKVKRHTALKKVGPIVVCRVFVFQ